MDRCAARERRGGGGGRGGALRVRIGCLKQLPLVCSARPSDAERLNRFP